MKKETIVKKIKELKQEKNAIILAHNYQIMPIQNIADFVGDSLQLARQAAKVNTDMIVFCGVQFMAETAKLLKPKAKVLLSAKNAGCPMADMITGEQLKNWKSDYKNPYVVCYVNSSVQVKAESDICCTSGNAVKVVKHVPENKTILFVPDQNLGTYVAQQTSKKVIVWKGFCNVHHIKITLHDVKKAKEKYPDYTLTAHPECSPEVFQQADVVASTKGMEDYVKNHDNVIIGTEIGLYHKLKNRFPEKKLVPLSEKSVCVNMKKTTLTDLYETLKNEKNEITIDEDIAERAVKSINKMLEIT